jgi:hypothetical protein
MIAKVRSSTARTFARISLAVILAGIACGRGYSDGERAGTISKLSYKGVAWKSWEGEMVLGGMVTDAEGHASANIWKFTVLDTRLVPAIQAAASSGRRVTVQYVQWLASPCSMDSDYEATAVR